MLLKVFSVFDSKTGVYDKPFYMPARGAAIRAFADAAADGSLSVGKHPEDYTLFELGEFDDGTAKFNMYDTPVSLGVALELKVK